MINLNKFSTEYFDDAVVGSSPLMMMKAIWLAKKGRSVILIDREENFGGNWQTLRLKNKDKVENACHLIEFFPGIYDLLEEYSGTAFYALNPQPIRVFNKSFIMSYSNNFLIILTGLRLIMGLIKSYIDLWRKYKNDYNEIINFKNKLYNYINYEIKNIFYDKSIKGPKDGYATFIEKLYEKASVEKVYFLSRDIQKLKLIDKKWNIIGENKKIVCSEKIHITTSTNLKHISKGNFSADKLELGEKKSAIVDIENLDIKSTQTYVAFWKDQVISRISKINTPGPAKPFQRFLVEIKKIKKNNSIDLEKAISQSMFNAGLLNKNAKIKIIEFVKCKFVQNIHQLPSGEIDYNLRAYHSKGNLAAGLAHWINGDDFNRVNYL